MNTHNNHNHNPYPRHSNQQYIHNYRRNNSNYHRNPINNNNNYKYQNNNNNINNTYHQYNNNRHHYRSNNNRHHHQNNYHNNNHHYHNNYHPNSHHNTYDNNNNRRNRPKPIRSQPKHEIISQTTGPLIVQQKAHQQPYFYDTQRPIAKRAIANKSAITNNPILDSNEKHRLIRDDQIYAIKQEQQLIEQMSYNIDITNGLPCSPECSPDLSENETESTNQNETSHINGIPNVKFGAMIESNKSIMECTKEYEMIHGNNENNNLLENDNNKDIFGIYSKKFIHKQAMIIPEKHTLGDCINRAMVKNRKGKNKNKKKGKRKRGGKKRNNFNDMANMSERERKNVRINMEVGAFKKFLEEAKENTRKNIMKS